jgi:hypothetical protein
MRANVRPIFRADAVRRYIQSQQKAVLPRFICPRTFLCLWILLGLLFLAGGIVTSHLAATFADGQVRGVSR